MTRALIGITTYGRSERGDFFLPAQYVDSVRRAGASAVLLPPGEDGLGVWLRRIDGLILSGGGDIEPASYGGRAHATLYMVDEERDRTELELATKVLETGLPTLAICRGTEVLNVALGGTLFEHLPEAIGEQVAHRLPPHQPAPHAIKVDEDSGLAAMLGETEFEAVSFHHQAIKMVAPTLEVVGRAPDGTIEAVEKRDHPWLFAVQWHPELTAADDPVQQRLFDALVAAALASRGG